jgi:hypothetical protein
MKYACALLQTEMHCHARSMQVQEEIFATAPRDAMVGYDPCRADLPIPINCWREGIAVVGILRGQNRRPSVVSPPIGLLALVAPRRYPRAYIIASSASFLLSLHSDFILQQNIPSNTFTQGHHRSYRHQHAFQNHIKFSSRGSRSP